MRRFCFLCAVAAGTFLVQAKPATAQKPSANGAAKATASVTNVTMFAKFAQYPRFAQLRAALMGALRAGDAAGMEKICRLGLELDPTDAVWHYNLACALAVRRKPNEAMVSLAKAIKYGFRDAAKIESDEDFKSLRATRNFPKLVAMARKLADKPVAGQIAPAAVTLKPGTRMTLTETNLVWDADIGMFRALVKPPAAKADAPVHAGTVYVNRDGNHSVFQYQKFPGMTRVDFPKAAHAYGAERGLPNTLYGGLPVFGNISLGMAKLPWRRSMVRAAMTGGAELGPHALNRLALCYLDNQVWCIPAVWDYPTFGWKPGERIGTEGDVYFPAVTPYTVTTVGISWSDLPFEAALARAAGLLLPETKRALVERKLFAPAMQRLLRMSQKGVNGDEDYLTAKAHPTAFKITALDTNRLYAAAAALKPDDIPPPAVVQMINSRQNPIPMYAPGRDYADIQPEPLFVSPCAVAFVLRAEQAKRTFLFRALALTNAAAYAWRVVHGDAACVKLSDISPTDTMSKGFVKIAIDRTKLDGRIDVACFPKLPDSVWGAPSFVCFSTVALERREYDAAGRLQSIDYMNASKRYSDPAIALPRNWKDIYTYAADGSLRSVTRITLGAKTEVFPAKEFRELRYTRQEPSRSAPAETAPTLIWSRPK